MTGSRTYFWVFVPLVLIVLISVMVALSASPPNGQFKDAATVLLVVTAVAVGVERTLELVWTGVGLLKGSFWPLNAVGEQIEKMHQELNAALEPIYVQTNNTLEQLSAAGKLVGPKLTEAQAELTKLKATTDDLASMAADSTQLQMFAAATAQTISYIQSKYTASLAAADLEKSGADQKAKEDAGKQARTEAKQDLQI